MAKKLWRDFSNMFCIDEGSNKPVGWKIPVEATGPCRGVGRKLKEEPWWHPVAEGCTTEVIGLPDWEMDPPTCPEAEVRGFPEDEV